VHAAVLPFVFLDQRNRRMAAMGGVVFMYVTLVAAAAVIFVGYLG
jgi:hypothetical protein